MPRYKVTKGRVTARPGMILETDNEVWARRYAARLELISDQDQESAVFLSDDFPGVTYLADAGIYTYLAVKEMSSEQLQEIKGIGKATANAITKAVNE